MTLVAALVVAALADDVETRATPHGADVETIPTQSGPTTLSTRTIDGVGGTQKYRIKPWDGYLATATGAPMLTVLGPIGGCTNTTGHFTKPSENARSHHCKYAVNGSPFHMDTGACIGRSIGNGSAICPSCNTYGVGFGLARKENRMHWIMGDEADVIAATLSAEKKLQVTEWVTGFYWLVRNGTIAPKPGGKKAPRTALGVTADGALLIFEVDGCEGCPEYTGGPTGLTAHDMGAWMRKLGALHAVNLDGGGSSTSVEDGRVIDWPTDKHIPYGVPQERAVTTAVCLM